MVNDMILDFIAKAPVPIWREKNKNWKRRFKNIIGGFWRILWQPLVPFSLEPEAPKPLPQSAVDLEKASVDQCQWIFDQAEARRLHLEQKAQSIFTSVSFLVPLLASVLVFLLNEARSTVPAIAIGLLILSALLLFLGFISILRAVSVKRGQTLFLGAVIHPEDGRFRKYNSGFHACGLLYCASVNTAINDYIAQFVKGAQVLAASAVIVFCAAAVPAGISFASKPITPMKTEVSGSLSVSSGDLVTLNNEIRELRKQLEALQFDKSEDWIKILDSRIMKLEFLIEDLRKSVPNNHK